MGLSEYKKYGSAADKLSMAIRNNKVSHAYIIEGDNNVNKLGFAKEFAKALMCLENPGEGCGHCVNCRKIENDNFEDLYDVKADGLSVKNGQVEELRSNLKTKPTGGDRNIAIIEDGDTMTKSAQASFLKTLEEPNPGTVIMILSENMQMNLLPTINSRCIAYRLINFDESDDAEMVGEARNILTMIKDGALFFDIRKELDSILSDRKNAYAFLDGIETVLGEYLRSGNSRFTDDELTSDVSFVEDARQAIQRNANYKYTIKNMILKLEEQ